MILVAGFLKLHDGRSSIAADGAIVQASTLLWVAPQKTPHRFVEGVANVPTVHDDPARLGWNQHERTLTTANVNAQTFGKLAFSWRTAPAYLDHIETGVRAGRHALPEVPQRPTPG